MRENFPTPSRALAIEVICVALTLGVSFWLPLSFGCRRLKGFPRALHILQIGFYSATGVRPAKNPAGCF